MSRGVPTLAPSIRTSGLFLSQWGLGGGTTGLWSLSLEGVQRGSEGALGPASPLPLFLTLPDKLAGSLTLLLSPIESPQFQSAPPPQPLYQPVPSLFLAVD